MPCGATKKKKACCKGRETLEVPVLSGQRQAGKGLLMLRELFQASRTSDPSSITLGILIFQNEAHHHHYLLVLFLMEIRDSFNNSRTLWLHLAILVDHKVMQCPQHSATYDST